MHKAKLRLLAPALRRALSASTQDAARRQDQAHREDQLQAPASMLLHGWTMAQWVSVCFSPADAPQLRIYWVLV